MSRHILDVYISCLKDTELEVQLAVWLIVYFKTELSSSKEKLLIQLLFFLLNIITLAVIVVGLCI